jgi:preprotein translocase subunit SecE
MPVKKLFNSLKNYVADVVAEMKKVSWVKRKELFTTTVVVIVFSTVLAAFIGLFDLLFSTLLQLVLR